tara:strand:- start:1330 stop:1947 length:618 start_codon:yes stop_codon:yes gene_type:complete
MESYISPLNYSIFVILYVTSFIYIYTTYAEIVGLGVLTVIQIAFTLFFGKELSQIITNNPGGQSVLNFASMMTLYGSFISMILLTITLALTSITIFDIQEKYNNTKGTPVILSSKYQDLFDTIKKNTVIVSVITFILLITYYLNKSNINVPILPLISNLSIANLTNNIPAIFNIGLSITSIVISSYQVKHAVDFSELKIHSLAGR